ncbi:MAG TPA: hypothetical protein VFJ29_06205, partial [Candidatus Kapabacteria bacterium]|nr:hypothetical protein [Candidatus Kapabacteria bacterium]
LTFHDRIPLLWQIGITPEFSLGIYNSQRTTNGNIPIPTNVPIPPYVDTVQTGVGVTYNFLTFDISAQNHIINAAHTLLFDFNHTSYNSALGSFTNPQNGQLITEPSTQYLYMNTFTGAYQFKGIAPSSTEEINPVGRSVTLSVTQNWNNVADTLVVSDNGLPIWLYLPYSYVTTSLTWQEHFQLPLWTHTLSFTIHSDVLTGGGIDAFNPRAHALFDSYIGGMIGMQGYPFYALGGSRTAYIKAIYRFPVSDHLDFRFLPIYFDKMYIGVFGDFGNAWNGDLTSSVFKSFKKDIGAELRIDAFMWYNVPTKFFFNAAYGLDDITNTFYISNNQAPQTVTYGKQWLFYGGIGFDFPD